VSRPRTQGACIVCGEPARARDRCNACYQYRRRTGADRSASRVARAGQLRMQRNVDRFEREEEAAFIWSVYRAAQHQLDEAGR